MSQFIPMELMLRNNRGTVRLTVDKMRLGWGANGAPVFNFLTKEDPRMPPVSESMSLSCERRDVLFRGEVYQECSIGGTNVMSPPPTVKQNSDQDLILALDGMSTTVGDWEANFLESVIQQVGHGKALTVKQKEVIYRMRDKYLPKWDES